MSITRQILIDTAVADTAGLAEQQKKKGVEIMKPKFVAISDIHFNLNNLQLCSQALSAALKTAEELQVALVIAGDLNDTKAIIRAEVANSIIEILQDAKVEVYILSGNHDMVNEKGLTHGLNYLRPYAQVIDFPCKFQELPGVLFIPYQSDADNFKAAIRQKGSKGDLLVCHQGVKGALMGDYIQDKSAIDIEILSDYRTISGHYHEHQTFGTLTYIGSPFTMTFGESAHDGKGYLVVNEDGTFERRLLDLRRHVIIDTTTQMLDEAEYHGADPFKLPRPQDLVWLKLRGPKSALDRLQKSDFAVLIGHSNFKLDKIVADSEQLAEESKPKTDTELLDALIDGTCESIDQKERLKSLWRELLS
jgi:DNA repair exonuclease SbcCD nuclease subunit